LRFARVVLGQILDDDARLGDGSILRLVTQHGELADRPNLLELRAGGLVGQVDNMRLEGDVVFVESDEHLLAEGREGMEIEFERHGGELAFAGA
jgi:hypothetical protein